MGNTLKWLLLLVAGCAQATPPGAEPGPDAAPPAPFADAAPPVPGAPDARPPVDPPPDAGPVTATETSCTDGVDNDGDGATDCADSECAAHAACSFVCPTGTTPVSISGGGLPMSIPDWSVAQVPLSGAGAGVVSVATVRVRIAHEFTGDLALVVEAPDGTSVTLSSDNGAGGPGYLNTVFADDAPTAITAGVPPFSGRFRPEQPLAALIGRGAAGAWTFYADDQAPFWTGTVEQVTVQACLCTGPDCETGAGCTDGADNDGDGATDCADTGCADAPGCVPEAACDNGADDDGDGATDCADADCAATAWCGAELDCGDGVDDDGDGAADCADPGCAVGCEVEERSCSDGVDNDGDGATDCADSACALACSLPACPAGLAAYDVRAGGLPVAIDDLATAVASVDVAGLGPVRRVAVRVWIDHTFDGDLDISLRGPDGTVVDLSSDNGSDGDDYDGTVLWEGASTAITTGSPPYAGAYWPEQSLDGYVGRASTGTWQLQVYDDAGSDTGSLLGYELALCADL